MSQNTSDLPDPIGKAIDRIKNPYLLTIIVVVGLLSFYSAFAGNATMAALTAVVGILAVVVLFVFDTRGVPMRVALVLPASLKDSNKRITRCDYTLLASRIAGGKQTGPLYPVRGPGIDALLCDLPKDARPRDVIQIKLKDEDNNDWRVDDFEPDLIWPQLAILGLPESIRIPIIYYEKLKDGIRVDAGSILAREGNLC